MAAHLFSWKCWYQQTVGDRFIRRLLVHLGSPGFCKEMSETKFRRWAKQHELVATRTMLQEFRVFRQSWWKPPTSGKEKLQQPCRTVNGFWRHQPRCLHIRAQHLLSFVWREGNAQFPLFLALAAPCWVMYPLAQTWQRNFIPSDDAGSISQWQYSTQLAGGLNEKYFLGGY